MWFVAFNSMNAMAQTNNESLTDSSHWQVGSTYQNDNVYLGRKDSSRLPYIIPSIGYYDKSGLFIDASLAYLAASGDNRIDLITIEGGYNYVKNNFEGQVVAAKFLYNSNSTIVKSEVKGSLDAYVAYDFDFIKPSFEVSGNFGQKSDVNLTVGLEHSFYALDSKLSIAPNALVNAGSRNYYDTYSNNKSIGGFRRKKNAVINNYTITASVKDASALKLLDYELNLPVNYTFRKFTFNLTPSYAIPVNPAITVVTIKNNTLNTQTSGESAEKLNNIFYFSIGVTYPF